MCCIPCDSISKFQFHFNNVLVIVKVFEGIEHVFCGSIFRRQTPFRSVMNFVRGMLVIIHIWLGTRSIKWKQFQCFVIFFDYGVDCLNVFSFVWKTSHHPFNLSWERQTLLKTFPLCYSLNAQEVFYLIVTFALLHVKKVMLICQILSRVISYPFLGSSKSAFCPQWPALI